MITRAEKWLLHPFRLYGLAIFGLLALALTSVAYGFASLVRNVEFEFLLSLMLVALLVGWYFARARLPGWGSGLLLVCLGVGLTIFVVGEFGELTIAWVQTLPGLLWHTLLRSDSWPEAWDAFQTAGVVWQNRWGALFADVGAWVQSLGTDNPTFNNTAVLFVWGLVIWLVAAWAGWIQRRRAQPLIAILPGAALLLGLLGYTYGPPASLLGLLFATLLLTTVSQYSLKERSWLARGMDFPEASRAEIFYLFFRVSFALLLVAAVIPQLSVQAIFERVQTWLSPQTAQVNPLLESFGLEQKSSLGALATVISGGLPRAHLIGSGSELSEQVVLQVQILNGLSSEELTSVPLYWRAITYDRYTGHGWDTKNLTVQAYVAGETTHAPQPGNFRLLEQSFTFLADNTLIYAAGDILSLDQPYRIAWRTLPAPPDVGDFFAGSVADTYRITSQIPMISEEELRAARAIYPDAIRARYLTLPASLPARVTDLARDLTRDIATPYDRARALERYLRTYEYELNLPEPSQNRDLVDTFLFELQKGYCDYFASAMVVMARAAGLPARLVVGYARGTYDPVQGMFTVTGENAHSWAEVYFEGIGWIPFEPTAALPEIIHPASAADQPPVWEGTLPERTPPVWAAWDFTPWVWGAGGIMLGMGVLLGLGFWIEPWILWIFPPSRLVVMLFQRLYRFGERLGTPPRLGETPYEFAARLEGQLLSITPPTRSGLPSEPGGTDIHTLADHYVRTLFSATPLTKDEKKQLLKLWPRLRGTLLLGLGRFWWLSKRYSAHMATPIPESPMPK